ncbi:unnamed protein product [Larinioides sclopetarius]|uniref:Uncharacterized protein n=1 Tax=Larinioides sclopetarius TaxID=280406 RepID=A0AAV1YWC9_9ARAC
MVSLQLVILCISIALFGLTLPESEAKSYSFTIPPGEDISDLDLSKLNLGSLNLNDVDASKIKLKQYSIPGTAQTHHYKLPGHNVTHTYHYSKPGKTNVHHHRYRKPGHTNVHTHRYKKPGHSVTHTHKYKKPGKTNTHTYHYKTEKPVTGVYYIINVIYNYFAVGGRLTGDLLLLRYYVAQGPKNFCPNN